MSRELFSAFKARETSSLLQGGGGDFDLCGFAGGRAGMKMWGASTFLCRSELARELFHAFKAREKSSLLQGGESVLICVVLQVVERA